MARRKNDFYPTPDGALQVLLENIKLRPGAWVYEPCVGTGNLSTVMAAEGLNVYTNDIDPNMDAHEHLDATTEWPMLYKEENFYHRTFDWVVTNPPFDNAFDILGQIIQNASMSGLKGVSLLLRLSFLEPTKERETFLSEFPPSSLIVLPRMSFTGDGKTDSVTCAWMTWDLPLVPGKETLQEIKIISRAEMEQAQQRAQSRAQGKGDKKGAGNNNGENGGENGEGGEGGNAKEGNGPDHGGEHADPHDTRTDRTGEGWRKHIGEFEDRFKDNNPFENF